MQQELLSGISTSFPALSRSQGQVTHALLTRSPLIPHPRKDRFTARLACVKHAASVHPEPGSNSPSQTTTTTQTPTTQPPTEPTPQATHTQQHQPQATTPQAPTRHGSTIQAHPSPGCAQSNHQRNHATTRSKDHTIQRPHEHHGHANGHAHWLHAHC